MGFARAFNRNDKVATLSKGLIHFHFSSYVKAFLSIRWDDRH